MYVAWSRVKEAYYCRNGWDPNGYDVHVFQSIEEAQQYDHSIKVLRYLGITDNGKPDVRPLEQPRMTRLRWR